MKKSYDLNELISFVNGEKSWTCLTDTNVTCQAENCHQQDEFAEVGTSASPDKRIISNILNYSRALSIVDTKSSGNFSLIMN